MGRSLSRDELYEAVWAKPRTELAKDFGVSDVAIAKQCKRARIPMPAAGYWAKLQHGKAAPRTALPLRFPGQPAIVAIGESEDAVLWRRFDPSEAIVEPVFREDIDVQVAAAMAIVGRVKACRDVSTPHTALARVLASEAQRRAKFEEHGWNSDRPRFDDVVHQRQLRIFNSLACALWHLSVSSEVFDNKEWILGKGEIHQLRLRMHFGGAILEIAFLSPEAASTDARRTRRPLPGMALQTVTRSEGVPAKTWADKGAIKLEGQLGEIVAALLRDAEEFMRRAAWHRHSWLLEQRQMHFDKLAAEREELERHRLAEVAARKAKIRDSIITLAADQRVAQDIRAMVDRLRARHSGEGSASARFSAWCQEALALADQLDPMKRSIEEIFGDFDRRDEIQH